MVRWGAIAVAVAWVSAPLAAQALRAIGSDEYGFSILIASGSKWREIRTETATEGAARFTVLSEGGWDEAYVSVTAGAPEEGFDAEGARGAWLDGLRADLGEGAIFDGSSGLEIDGHPAVEARFSETRNDQVVKYRFVATIANGRLYVLSFIGLGDSFYDDPAYRELIEGFSFPEPLSALAIAIAAAVILLALGLGAAFALALLKRRAQPQPAGHDGGEGGA
jgi:hypothetical protein